MYHDVNMWLRLTEGQKESRIIWNPNLLTIHYSFYFAQYPPHHHVFFPALLRNDCHTSLYKFKVYSMIYIY